LSDSSAEWHVYFDTNQFKAGGWPAEIQSLDRLRGFAVSLGIKLFLPEPVQLELEEQWLREFSEKHEKLARAEKDFGKHRAKILPEPPAPRASTMSQGEARARYREREGLLREKFHIQVSGFTALGLDAVFGMAVRREPPFSSGDAMFRDAVILRSILEHAKSQGCTFCILVTGDTGLLKPEVRAVVEKEGLQFMTFQTINELNDCLAGLLEDAQKFALEADKERALRALEANRDGIQKFIETRLDIPEHELQGIYGIIRGINRLELEGFTNVRTPFPPSEETDVQVAISVDVSLKVHVAVERYSDPPPRTFRIGEAQGSGDAAPFTVWTSAVLGDQTCRLEVELEATSRRGDDRSYLDITPQSVQIKPSFGSMLAALARGGAQAPGQAGEESR
jgi:hypothetical protein